MIGRLVIFWVSLLQNYKGKLKGSYRLIFIRLVGNSYLLVFNFFLNNLFGNHDYLPLGSHLELWFFYISIFFKKIPSLKMDLGLFNLHFIVAHRTFGQSSIIMVIFMDKFHVET